MATENIEVTAQSMAQLDKARAERAGVESRPRSSPGCRLWVKQLGVCMLVGGCVREWKTMRKQKTLGKPPARVTSNGALSWGEICKIKFFLAECSLKRLPLPNKKLPYLLLPCCNSTLCAFSVNKRGHSKRNPVFLSSSSLPNATKPARPRFWLSTCTMGTEILAGIKSCAAQIRSSYQELERWRTIALCLGGWGPCLPTCCRRLYCLLPFGRLLQTLAWSCYCWSKWEFCHWLQGEKMQALC